MTFRNLRLRTALVAASALAALQLHAQITANAPAEPVSVTEDQKLEILGGAAYAHFNPGFATQVEATNLLGWEGGVTGWFSPLFGIEGTARGVYGNYTLPAAISSYPSITNTTSSLSEHLFLFGPSFRLYQSQKYTAGFHVLVGGAYGSFDQGFQGSGIQPFQVGVYNNQLALGYALGGWADYKVYPHFAVRFTADYQPTRYGHQGQSEFFGAIGIVYKIGHRNK